MTIINKEYFINRNWEIVIESEDFTTFRERGMKEQHTIDVKMYSYWGTIWINNGNTFLRSFNEMKQFEKLYEALFDKLPALYAFPRKILLEKVS